MYTVAGTTPTGHRPQQQSSPSPHAPTQALETAPTQQPNDANEHKIYHTATAKQGAIVYSARTEDHEALCTAASDAGPQERWSAKDNLRRWSATTRPRPCIRLDRKSGTRTALKQTPRNRGAPTYLHKPRRFTGHGSEIVPYLALSCTPNIQPLQPPAPVLMKSPCFRQRISKLYPCRKGLSQKGLVLRRNMQVISGWCRLMHNTHSLFNALDTTQEAKSRSPPRKSAFTGRGAERATQPGRMSIGI